jgi:hypothetical protein
MKPEQIEKILGLKTYSMIAKDQGNRDKMITIIADILEMSAEVSPLLQPLLERDNYTEKAVKALEDTKFEEAVIYFEKISDLCIELGDDSLGKEFYEKSQKIKTMLQRASTPQEVSIEEPPKQKAEPPKPIEEPPKPIEEPPKPIEEPPKPIEEPPKPIEEPPKPIEEPTKPIEEPPKPIEEPPKPIEEPPKPIKEPPKPIEAVPKPKVEAPMPKAKVPVLKKPTMPDTPKVEALVKPNVPIAVPPPPGPPQRKIIAEKEQKQEFPVEPEKKPIAPPQPGLIKKPEIPEEGKTSEPEIIIKPQIQQSNKGLNLNPEDFMVKQRPKTVTIVPKDAKNKLKTSPFAHVSNPVEPTTPIPVSPTKLVKTKAPSGFVPPSKTERPKAQSSGNIPKESTIRMPEKSTSPSIPVSPTSLIKPTELESKPKTSKAPSSTIPPVVPDKEEPPKVQAPSVIANVQQKSELEKSLMDLRIKKANITKMSLDFDMKELTGEITHEELEIKKQKLKTIESNIDQQISEIEKLLNN